MTLRSRKKPPITVPKQRALEAEASDISLVTWEEHAQSGRFRAAATIAVVFATLLVCLALPVEADTKTPAWSPTRPKKSLASTRVSFSKRDSAAQVAQRDSVASGNGKLLTKSGAGGWNQASRLEDTSPHLSWKDPRQEQPPRQGHVAKAAGSRAQPRKPLRVVETPRLQEMPRLVSAEKRTTKPLESTRLASERPMTRPRVAAIQTAAPTEAGPRVRLVQSFEDLELPFPEALDPDLSINAEEVEDPEAPTAPSPRDVFAKPSKAATNRIRRDTFKDQTPNIFERNRPVPTRAGPTLEQLTPNRPPAAQRLRPAPKPEPATVPETIQVAEPELVLEPEMLDVPAAEPVPATEIVPVPKLGSESRTKSVQIEQPSRFDDPPSETPSQLMDELPVEETPNPLLESIEGLFEPETDSELADQPEDTPSAILDLVVEPQDKAEPSFAEQPNDTQAIPSDEGTSDDATEALQLPAPPANDVPNPLLFGDDDDVADDDDKQAIRELSATNGRDCSAESESCRTDFALLRRRERTNMSLDITPSIEPREVDMARVEEVRIEKLAKAPSRTWTGIDGNVLTDGKLEDYRDGRVFVRTLNGSLREFAPHRLSDEDWCFVTSWWDIPPECRFENEEYAVRDFRLTTFTWTAPSTCHKPLYFEQVGVERYGHSSGPIVQPLVSGVHFFGDVFMLPYKMGLNPPNECVYPLGHYRPGDCAPWLIPGFPFTTRGFTWQGLAVGGAIALLP